MPCNTLIEPACRVAGNVIRSVTTSAAGDVLGGIAQAITAGVRWIVENTATWWLRIPSPNLAAEPAVTRIQQWLLPITIAVAIGGVITAGARMALTRRANPLIDVTSGLLTVAAASTLGVTAMTLLLKAGDAWSAWVLQVSTGGHFTQRLILALNLGGAAAPAVVLVCGTIAIFLSLVQAVLMLFRQAALIILAGVLPLACVLFVKFSNDGASLPVALAETLAIGAAVGVVNAALIVKAGINPLIVTLASMTNPISTVLGLPPDPIMVNAAAYTAAAAGL